MRYKSLLFIIVIAGFFIASYGGRSDARAGAPNDLGTCSSCHSGGGTPTGSIDITGAPSVYTPGQTYPMSITVTEPTSTNGILSASGFQIVATNGVTNVMQGNFSITGTGTRILTTGAAKGRLVQNSPRAFTSTTATWTFDWTAPSTDAPEEIVFFYAGNAVNENGNTGGDIVYFSATTSLPVEWSYVEVQTKFEDNYINWGTEIEVNNSHFEIEHSVNGSDFIYIGQRKGAGESRIPLDYEFIHENVGVGNHYYRVKQVDYDGRSTYSETLSTFVNPESVEIYPNTIEDGFLRIYNGESDAKVMIYSLDGNQVKSTGYSSIIDISSLQSGMYIIQYLDTNGQNVTSTKVFKI